LRLPALDNTEIQGEEMFSKTWAALAMALTLPFLHGCGNDDANKGQVRIVNATTEYSSLDLYWVDSDSNNVAIASGTVAGAVSGYDGVDRGTHTFNIKSNGGAGIAATTSGTLSKEKHYSVVAYLTGNALKAQFLTDEEDTPNGSNAKLRVFNAASSEASSVDVYLTTADCSTLGVTDSAVASAVTGLQDSFTLVSPAAWNLCVTTAGDKTSLLLSTALTLTKGEIATLILTHTSGGVLLNSAVLDQQGAYTAHANTIARIRAVANAASAKLVSATVNNVSLVADAPSPSVGSYVTVPAGTLTTTLVIDGTTITGTTLGTAVAGNDYTLLVSGTAGSPTPVLITDDNTPSTSTSLPVKARVINGLNGTSGSLSVTVDSKAVGTAAFNSASTPYVTLAATTGTSTVRATTSGTSPAALINQTFASGSVYTIFVFGDASAPTLQPNQDR
jgi:hypothetical protein